MPQYAYRAIAEDGKPVRVAAQASNPQELIEQARSRHEHVVMVYLFVEGERPHFRQLFRHPNRPLPKFLDAEGASRCGLPVRRKISDWVWTTPQYETGPLFQKLSMDLRKLAFEHLGQESREHSDSAQNPKSARSSEKATRDCAPIGKVNPCTPDDLFWQPHKQPNWKYETWPAANPGLPPLPELDAEEESRLELFFDSASYLVESGEMISICTVGKMVRLLLLCAIRDFDGIRVAPEEVSFLSNGEWRAELPMPEALCEPVIVVLAGIAGINLELLSSAPAEYEITVAAGRYLLTAETELADLGERFEMHWRRVE